MLQRSHQNFAHITTVTVSWRVQNFVVIGRGQFKPEHFIFWYNFEFDRNAVSGTGAWSGVCRSELECRSSTHQVSVYLGGLIMLLKKKKEIFSVFIKTNDFTALSYPGIWCIYHTLQKHVTVKVNAFLKPLSNIALTLSILSMQICTS